MKIENSNISLASTHAYSQSMSSKSSVSVRIAGAKDNSLGFYQNFLRTPLEQLRAAPTKTSSRKPADSLMSIKLQLIHKIFDAICGRRKFTNPEQLDASEIQQSNQAQYTLWERVTQTSMYYSEEESTTFAARGLVQTADGRSIDFGVEMSMSRSFTAVYDEYQYEEYMVTDPLIINVDSDVTSVSDVKFFFDLDADGEKEEISFAGKGCGFLALDENEDGIINDGSELFGTKSGNGFADLAKYDKDGNGWIDENDQIYSKLRVWTKDEEGNDQLMDLEKAGVGAIYLGSSRTEFALTDENNYVNAYIRSTGVFLRENGSVGTISQVDFTS